MTVHWYITLFLGRTAPDDSDDTDDCFAGPQANGPGADPRLALLADPSGIATRGALGMGRERWEKSFQNIGNQVEVER